MADRRFALSMSLAPGDATVLTAVVRDIAATYGSKYEVEMRTNQPLIFANNPHVCKTFDRRAEIINMHGHTPGMARAGNGEMLHFARYLYERFEEQTGIKVPMLKSKPDLHLSEKELNERPISGRYWLVFGGGKSDITIKHWPSVYYQSVVDQLLAKGIHCVQSGGRTKSKTKHIHPPLDNVLNIVGWGGIREMIWQIYHADGIICPITAAMHMGAAFDKPCVVIAGGREDPQWEAYTNEYGAFGSHAEPVKVPHRFLHNVGLLGCRGTQGCWKKLVVKDASEEDRICVKPKYIKDQPPVAECMSLITPGEVVDAVLSYYSDGTLPPPTPQAAPTLLATETAAPRVIVERVNVTEQPELFGPVGEKLTIATTLYGDYHALHKRCITSILDTVAEKNLKLRVVCNQVPKDTLAWLETLPIEKMYVNSRNEMKNPSMRKVIHDMDNPVRTPFLVWMDDDVYCVRSDWVKVLSTAIQANHANGVGMYGEILSMRLSSEEEKRWFREATWHKGKPFRTRQSAPGGDWIHYCRPSFWCASMEALLNCDIPDQRLLQKGAAAIGEQLWQNDYYVKNLNTGGNLVSLPMGLKRGYSEKLPWQKQAEVLNGS